MVDMLWSQRLAIKSGSGPDLDSSVDKFVPGVLGVGLYQHECGT